MSLDGTAQTRMQPSGGVMALHWAAEGLYVYEFAPRFVWLQPWGGGERGLLFELPESVVHCTFLRGTGEIELICTQGEQTVDAWLIENFDPHVK